VSEFQPPDIEEDRDAQWERYVVTVIAGEFTTNFGATIDDYGSVVRVWS
jgi:hypothetical protein